MPHLTAILSKPESGLGNMIDQDKLDDLARLYRLFSKVSEGPHCLRKSLRESIILRGRTINSSNNGGDLADGRIEDLIEDHSKSKVKGKARPTNPASQLLNLALKWVQDVLNLKDKFDQIWTKSFDSNHEIGSCLDEVRYSSGQPEQFLNFPLNRLLALSSIFTKRPPNTYHCLSMRI